MIDLNSDNFCRGHTHHNAIVCGMLQVSLWVVTTIHTTVANSLYWCTVIMHAQFATMPEV